MPERRTQVLVSFRVDNIDTSGVEDISIPVRLEGEPDVGGAAGAGAGAAAREPSQRRGGTFLWAGAGPLGTRMTVRLQQAWDTVYATVIRLLPEIVKFTTVALPILAAVAFHFTTIYVQAKLALFIIRQLGQVGKIAFGALVSGAQAASQAFIRFSTWAVQTSIDAMQRFVEEAANLGHAAYQHIEQFVKTAITTFAEFEQSIANTVTVMGQFGEAGMRMRDQVTTAMKDLTISSRIMATEAGRAAYEIASAGFSRLQQVIDMTRGSITLAEATLSDVVQTGRAMVATMNQFNLVAGMSTRVANVFAAAISKSPATMTKLTQALEYAGPIARSFNISLERAVAALMGFFKQGRSGSRAGTEFRIVLASLAKQTDKSRKVLAELGMDIAKLSPARVGILGIVKAFEQLQQRVGQIKTVESIYQAFPVRAASGMVALLGVGSAALAKMREQITGTNVAFQMQADQLLTLSGFWDKLVSLWENVYYDVLERGLSPALQSVLKVLRDLAQQARETGVFTEFGNALASIIPYAEKMIQILGPRLLQTIQALVGMLPQAIQHIGRMFIGLSGYIETALADLPDLVGRLLGKMLPVISQLFSAAMPLLVEFAQTVAPALIDIFAELGSAIAEFLGRNKDTLIDWFKFLLDTGKRLVGFLPSLQGPISDLLRRFVDFLPVLVSIGINALPKLLDVAIRLAPALTKLAQQGVVVLWNALNVLVSLLEGKGVPAFRELVGSLGRLMAIAMAVGKPLVNILAKGIVLVHMAMEALAGRMPQIGGIIVRWLTWLDENFSRVVTVAIGLVKGLFTQLQMLGRVVDWLSPLLYMLVAPLEVLSIIMLAMKSAAWVLTNVFANLIENVGQAIGFLGGKATERAMKQFASNMRKGANDSVAATARMMWDLAKIPNAMRTIGREAALGLDPLIRGLGDVEAAMGPGTRGPMMRQLAPAAAAGRALSPQPYNYQVSLNFNDYDTMRRTLQAELDKMDRDRQKADRLSGTPFLNPVAAGHATGSVRERVGGFPAGR